MHLFLTIFIQAVFEQGPVALAFTNTGKTAMRKNYIQSALRQHYANQRNNEEKPVNKVFGDSTLECNIWALYSSVEFRNDCSSAFQTPVMRLSIALGWIEAAQHLGLCFWITSFGSSEQETGLKHKQERWLSHFHASLHPNHSLAKLGIFQGLCRCTGMGDVQKGECCVP